MRGHVAATWYDRLVVFEVDRTPAGRLTGLKADSRDGLQVRPYVSDGRQPRSLNDRGVIADMEGTESEIRGTAVVG